MNKLLLLISSFQLITPLTHAQTVRGPGLDELVPAQPETPPPTTPEENPGRTRRSRWKRGSGYPAAGPLPETHFQKHAVLMIAINYSEGEIEAAKSAATARGEEFHLIPEITPALIRRGNAEYEREQFSHRQLEPLYNARQKASGAQKTALDKRIKAASARLDVLDHRSEGEKFERPDVMTQAQDKIKALEAQGIGIDSLVISGHDGGGHFGGTFGNTSVQDLSDLAERDKVFKSSLRSVYLLGCYTATTDQARDWKGYFPHVEMVAGYDQAAPLRDAPKGWNYLHDTMVLENKLTATKDVKELNLLAKQVTDINKSFTAFSTFPKCDDPKLQKQFYRGKITRNEVTEFDIKMCTAALPEFEKNLVLYHKYELGELPLPENTAASPLRELYTFYRNHEICYGENVGTGPHADEVFFLLFNRGVRANFAKYYSTTIKALAHQLDAINFKSVLAEARKTFSSLYAKSNRGELSEEEREKLSRADNLKELLKDKPDLIKKTTASFAQLLNPAVLNIMSLEQMRDLASNATEVYDLLNGYESYKNNSNRVGLGLAHSFGTLTENFDRMVIARRCLPMSWHEEAKGMPETPHCED